MNYVTMVSRYGDPKQDLNLMTFNLIGDDFSVHSMRGDKLAAAINAGKLKVTNMAVSVRGLESTNGSINNYTTIGFDNNIIGQPRYVILNRIEKNGKLTGYVAYGINGVVAELSVPAAVNLCNSKLIANGKIKHTDAGDIVSSIKGTYPLINTVIKEVKDSVTSVALYFGSVIKGAKSMKYVGLITCAKNTRTISGMYPKFEEANRHLRAKLSEAGFTAAELTQFDLKQANGAGIYGIYELGDAKKILEAGDKKFDKMVIIGCRDCSDLENPESFVVCDTKTKSVQGSQKGTNKSDEFLKSYVKEVLAEIK